MGTRRDLGSESSPMLSHQEASLQVSESPESKLPLLEKVSDGPEADVQTQEAKAFVHQALGTVLFPHLGSPQARWSPE